MTIKIIYKNSDSKKLSSNLVLFTNEKFNISNLKKSISSSEFSYISDLLKTSDLKKDLFVFELNSKKKIVLISIKNNLKISEIENLGAKLTTYFGKKKSSLSTSNLKDDVLDGDVMNTTNGLNI